ncbi:MAG: ArsR/SmtB family transcription factor [Thermonemataceae bacterium]
MQNIDTKFVEKATNAIADKYRLSILLKISEKGHLSMSEVTHLTGLSQPCSSHHVKILTDSELVQATKEGRNVSLQINKDKMETLIHLLKFIK